LTDEVQVSEMSGKKPWRTNWNQNQDEDDRIAIKREQDKKQKARGKTPATNTLDSLASLSLEECNLPPASEAQTDGAPKPPASTTRSSVGGAWGGSTAVRRGTEPGGTVSTGGNGKESKPLQTR